MTIEVKQMIIKSTLVDENSEQGGSHPDNADIEKLRQQIVEECRRLIEQSLEKSRER